MNAQIHINVGNVLIVAFLAVTVIANLFEIARVVLQP